MNLGIEGKTALVAASSRGLGRAIATELAVEGVNLALCARGPGRLANTADEIRSMTGVDVLAEPVDLSDSDAVDRFAESVLDRFGGIDILVNNAGGPPAGTFEDHAPSAWDAAIRLNLRSALDLTRHALPGMKRNGWGRIINVTSVAVKEPVEGLILSNSVRAAVTGFARTLANEVASCGITVNNVLPGYHATDRLKELAGALASARGVKPSDIEHAWTEAIPAGRLGDPAEFAAVVAFLASARASYVTGVSLVVDGGRTRSLL